MLRMLCRPPDERERAVAAVEKKMPRRVKRKRPIMLEDGTQAGGMEEYYDYIFPVGDSSRVTHPVTKGDQPCATAGPRLTLIPNCASAPTCPAKRPALQLAWLSCGPAQELCK